MSLQQDIIAKLGVKPEIDVDAEIRKRVDFLKEYVLKSGVDGLLIAISGGIDSSVTTGLCKLATDELTAEKGREYKTVGVFQPYGEQADISDSYATAEAFDLKYRIETNIEEAVNEIALEAEYGLKSIGIHKHLSRGGKGNVKARTRMVIQYALAFELNLLVVGTDHASEAITGFFTKYGDGAVDITPLSSLNKRQVRQLAAKLGVPQSVLDKAPTAGLWEGQTDENELGITYEDNSSYLEGKSIPAEAKEKLEKQYLRTEHKRTPIPGI
ncbi:ammonia-dependent NAD(+) synthetase [Paenibacillus allorhizosphaerae]|uniref:NH(3)-dependent NAD(+) synthetase n=1 Tax=Paenibacillus allorhizosphaerae TaxID=2849866 RepID=A0ABN7TU10_9BACL|nr:ammonia-dependent NAD(+) synthetase [Paenibacillus allorhizosphaerae]CAG7649827.1 NH(3)-dependent NAD(+) synthetase [Paenibacillus allorhizosphaerae]